MGKIASNCQRQGFKASVWIVALGFYLICASASHAIPPLPGNADPGRVIENHQQPVEPKLPPSTTLPTSPVTEPHAPAGAKKAEFQFNGLVIEGVTVYKAEDLAPLYMPFVGKRIPVSKLYEITEAITARYQQDGYVLSKAVLPPQKIGAEPVKIRVIEGYIRKVEFDGHFYKSWIINVIADRITHYQPLNIKKLERDLLLLNDLVGVSAEALFKTPEASEVHDESQIGAVDLALVFKEVPSESRISVDNFNSRYIGPYEMVGQTSINHFILPYQQLSLSGITSMPMNNMRYIQAAQLIPLNSYGTTATAQWTYARTAPGYTLGPDELKSDAYNYGINFSHPLLRSRLENLYIGVGLIIKNIYTDALEQSLYNDRLRIANASVTYNKSDSLGGVSLAQVKVDQGLNIFNASKTGSPDLSRADGHSDFTAVIGNISRLQSLTQHTQLYIAGTGQYANVPLLSSEQFGFGGQQFGRAYDSSELTGDEGITGTVELRYSFKPILSIEPQLYTFYDIGRVWNVHAYNDGISAADAGIGIRISSRYISGSLALAEPLTKKIEAPEYGNGSGPRILMSFGCEF